jgi:hypothetical protein
MKMVAEYLERAIEFEAMAAGEKDAKLKADLEKQAAAYRKLAANRAKEYNLGRSPLSTQRVRQGNLSLHETAWWGWEDSNFQPNDYQPPALSIEHSGAVS